MTDNNSVPSLLRTIRDLELRLAAFQMGAYRIEDRHRARLALRRPFAKTPAEKLRLTRQGYDAVRRAKLCRAQAAPVAAQLEELRVQLAAARAADARAAALVADL